MKKNREGGKQKNRINTENEDARNGGDQEGRGRTGEMRHGLIFPAVFKYQINAVCFCRLQTNKRKFIKSEIGIKFGGRKTFGR